MYYGKGADKANLEAMRESNRARSEEHEREREIIEHVEKATNTKAITVDGELKYIPVAKAIKLGLIE